MVVVVVVVREDAVIRAHSPTNGLRYDSWSLRVHGKEEEMMMTMIMLMMMMMVMMLTKRKKKNGTIVSHSERYNTPSAMTGRLPSGPVTKRFDTNGWVSPAFHLPTQTQ